MLNHLFVHSSIFFAAVSHARYLPPQDDSHQINMKTEIISEEAVEIIEYSDADFEGMYTYLEEETCNGPSLVKC